MKALLPVLTASIIALGVMQGYAQAETKPSKQMAEFFELDKGAQENYVANGVLMIGVVASQTAPNIAKCIDDWYGKSAAQRDDEIISKMRELPQYTPATIILAVVEKACGKFNRAN